MNEIVWHPDDAAVAAARVTAFRRETAERLGLDLPDHDSLYAWSVADRAAFWDAVWRFCGVVGERRGDEIVRDGDRMPGARWFPEARLNYAENLLQRDDDGPAVIHRREDGLARRLSRAELRRQVAALAARLREEGVVAGDRVAGVLPNVPEAIVAMLAAASIGAVWSSTSPDFGVAGILDRFGQIAPKVLFCADGHLHGGKAHAGLGRMRELVRRLPSVRRVVVAPQLGIRPDLDGLPRAELWDDMLASPGPGPLEFARLPFDHPLFVMYSSGTTGLPKGIVHGAGGTLLQHLKEHVLHCDLRPDDRFLYFTTCGWMMWNWLVSGLATGATVVLYDGAPMRPPAALFDLVAEERLGILGVGARYLAACEKAGLSPRDTHDLSSLGSILSTGSPLLPGQFDWVRERVGPDVRLSSISGGTDIISCFALGSPVLPVRRGELQCRGLGMDVAVFDEDGRPVTGRKGELVCRAPFPSMPVGFWNDPDGSRYHAAYFERFEGVWAHGDFAELRPEGGLVIHGRSDAVLNPGGVRIGTAEIYRVVDRFDEIVESVAVGRERDGDVRIVLFVVLREGAVLDDGLRARIRARLRDEASPRHVPAVIRDVPEIPHTISGKIVEAAVRETINGRPVRNRDALANPEALAHFRDRLRQEG